jgi:hypothetical protein
VVVNELREVKAWIFHQGIVAKEQDVQERINKMPPSALYMFGLIRICPTLQSATTHPGSGSQCIWPVLGACGYLLYLWHNIYIWWCGTPIQEPFLMCCHICSCPPNGPISTLGSTKFQVFRYGHLTVAASLSEWDYGHFSQGLSYRCHFMLTEPEKLLCVDSLYLVSTGPEIQHACCAWLSKTMKPLPPLIVWWLLTFMSKMSKCMITFGIKSWIAAWQYWKTRGSVCVKGIVQMLGWWQGGRWWGVKVPERSGGSGRLLWWLFCTHPLSFREHPKCCKCTLSEWSYL